jgi:hypothetical protein
MSKFRLVLLTTVLLVFAIRTVDVAVTAVISKTHKSCYSNSETR